MDLLVEFVLGCKDGKETSVNEQKIQKGLLNLVSNTSATLEGKTCYEEKYFFKAFNELAYRAFNGLLKRASQVEEENCTLREKLEKAELKSKEIKEKLDKVQISKSLDAKCRTCSSYEVERSRFNRKYENLERQLKKCAVIINSSLDGGTKVLGRVREVLTQPITDENELLEHNICESFSEPPKPQLTKCSNAVPNLKPTLALDEDDASILAPSSPDENDIETQDCGGFGEGRVFCIPETVPFDLPPSGVKASKRYRNQNLELSPSPIIRKRSPPRVTFSNVRSPLKLSSTPAKVINSDSSGLLDASIYSPPVLTDFTSPKLAYPTTEAGRSTVDSSKMPENIDPKRTLVEQQTPKSKKSKCLKQTKLTSTIFDKNINNGQGSVTDFLSRPTFGRTATKTVKISPPSKTESKRRRKGKDPEDWQCRECYRLFREAEAAKKIDVRKMPVSMNFCPDHFNRYSYYLNTPPGFWDCGIGKSPRKGLRHSLYTAATNDDDDFVE